jgi:beta-glucosidase
LKIGLIGPNAHSLYNQLGDYTPPQRDGQGVTVLQGLRNAGAKVTYHPGCPMFAPGENMIAEALEATGDCDVLVAVVGGSSSRFAIRGEFDTNGALKSQSSITMDCGENVDNASLQLPGDQLRLLTALKKTGKPVITVLIGGRPYEMAAIDAASRALLCAFYPGPTGGEAIAKLLLGEIEPAGRLSVSLPDDGKRLPVYYNHKSSYRPMAYYDGAAAPRYGFGAGFGYTQFAFRVTQEPTAQNRQLTVLVKNTGSRPGYAVPQLYLRREQGVVTGRVMELCGFEKVRLLPGEEVSVALPIPEESLMQWDYAMVHRLVPGKISWFLRDSGKTQTQGAFVL